MAKGKKSVESVEFRQLKDGTLISNTRHKTARGGQGGGPEFDYGHDELSHPTMEHAQDHLAKVFDTESGTDKDGKYNKEDRGGPEAKEEIE